MRIPRDPGFDTQAERYRLRYTCEACGFFIARPADRPECAHGWPTDSHREARYRLPTVDVIFCKEFEAR